MSEEEIRKIGLAKRDFYNLSHDLLRSKYHNFENNLILFVNFCETNEVMKRITEPLKANSHVDLKDWWTNISLTGGSFVGSKRYELPLDEEGRLALLYQFLVALSRHKLDFLQFASWVYGYRRFDDNVYAFNEDISKKLIRALNYKLDDIEKEKLDILKNQALKPVQIHEKWDLFVSYATEDKKTVVEPLVEAFRKEGLRVWYDEFELKVGDSLRRSIDKGIIKSKFGVVILSHNFFAKEWPQRELDGLTARNTRILPVWHEIEKEEVAKYSPMLADIKAARTSEGLPSVIKRLLRVVRAKSKIILPDISKLYHKLSDIDDNKLRKLVENLGYEQLEFLFTLLLDEMSLVTHKEKKEHRYLLQFIDVSIRKRDAEERSKLFEYLFLAYTNGELDIWSFEIAGLIEDLLKSMRLRKFIAEKDLTNDIILRFAESQSFMESAANAKIILRLADVMSNEQLDRVLKASIENDQIYESYRTKDCLLRIIRRSQSKLNSKLVEKLKTKIGEISRA